MYWLRNLKEYLMYWLGDFLFAITLVAIMLCMLIGGMAVFVIMIPLMLAGMASLFGGNELTQVGVACCYYILAGLYFYPHLFESNRRRRFYIHL